jgi:hypothetical protein
MSGKKEGCEIMGKWSQGLFCATLSALLMASLVGCGLGSDEDGETGSVTDPANDGLMQVDADLPFVFEEPLADLPKDHAFTYQIGFDPKALPSMQADEYFEDYSSAFVVYADSQFRKSVETNASYDEATKELSISPSGDVNLYVDSGLSERHALPDVAGVTIGGSSTDGGSGWPIVYPTYYLVQYVDLQSGQPLDKPIVTQFSTVQPENLLEAPMVSADVDQDGFAVFDWEKVEGAKGYYIVKYERESSLGFVDYTAIGYSEETHWVSSEDDDKYLGEYQKHTDNNWGIDTQNYSFKCFRWSDDELRDALYEDSENPANAAYDFGVIAVGDNQWSTYATIDTDALIARLPVARASNANNEIYETIPEELQHTFDGIPVTAAITMADGSTGSRVLLPDSSMITDSTLYLGPSADEVTQYKTKEVACRPTGTMLYGTSAVIEFDEATLEQEAERILARNLEEQPKTGLITGYEYTGTPGLDPAIIASAVKTTPQVPYPVNGTTSMVRHIAACAIAGIEYVDCNAYLNQPGAPDIWDACEEAFEQNPYILGNCGSGYLPPVSYTVYLKHGIVAIAYNGNYSASEASGKFLEERTTRQDVLLALATGFADTSITLDMSDEDKARAIVEFISEKATYSWDAFDALENPGAGNTTLDYQRCWDADGALVDGSAVCVGYAQAFKVLADASGLEAVCVSGSTEGSRYGHQWNKVRIDGEWTIVDVTWIDADPGYKWEYFGIADDEAKRTQDKGFVVDFYIQNYAAV